MGERKGKQRGRLGSNPWIDGPLEPLRRYSGIDRDDRNERLNQVIGRGTDDSVPRVDAIAHFDTDWEGLEGLVKALAEDIGYESELGEQELEIDQLREWWRVLAGGNNKVWNEYWKERNNTEKMDAEALVAGVVEACRGGLSKNQKDLLVRLVEVLGEVGD